MLDYVDRFGVKAVTGKDVLGMKEMREMIIAENIRKAFWSRANFTDGDGNNDWAALATRNPDLSRYLVFAAEAAEDV